MHVKIKKCHSFAIYNESWLFILCLTLLTGCNSSISVFDGEPLKILQNGHWIWEAELDNCAKAGQKISAIDNIKLLFEWYDNDTGEKESSYEYKINQIDGAYLNLSKMGELEKDSFGQVVTWDLIIKSPLEYCWRRSDWNPLLCTQAMIQCGS